MRGQAPVLQAYNHHIRVRNDLHSAVDATVRPGSPARWTVSPSKFRLQPGHSIDLTLQLQVLKSSGQRTSYESQRDIFHIKTPYFEQKYYAVFSTSATCGARHPQSSCDTSGNISCPTYPTQQSLPKTARNYMRPASSDFQTVEPLPQQERLFAEQQCASEAQCRQALPDFRAAADELQSNGVGEVANNGSELPPTTQVYHRHFINQPPDQPQAALYADEQVAQAVQNAGTTKYGPLRARHVRI